MSKSPFIRMKGCFVSTAFAQIGKFCGFFCCAIIIDQEVTIKKVLGP